MSSSKNINIAREVLLVEIERRCRDARCNARTRIGLTKEEARAYCGFECESCKHFWPDALTERDIPEWWEGLAVTDLHALRQAVPREREEPGEVVGRMSENFRLAARKGDDQE
ncbi:MAG TPA: hypothetical protein VF723_13540 [Pyrinomonadaceae bacterium]|jgi:hypothetical protein